VRKIYYWDAQPTRGGLIDGREMKRRAEAILERLHLHVDVNQLLGDYSIAVQQMVASAARWSSSPRSYPRRAHLQPRRRRGRAAVQGDAEAEKPKGTPSSS